MISKPLFKQSVKANLSRWIIVTIVSCFIVATVILILGRLNVNEMKKSIEDLFVASEKEANIKKQSINLYNNFNTLYDSSIASYDSSFEIVKNTIYMYRMASSQMGDGAKDYVVSQIKSQVSSKSGDDVGDKAGNIASKSIDSYNNDSSKDASSITKDIVQDMIYEQVTKDSGKKNASISKTASLYFINNYLSDDATDKDSLIINYIGDLIYNSTKEKYSEKTASAARSASKESINSYKNLLSEGYSSKSAYKKVTTDLTKQLPKDVLKSIVEIRDLDVYGLVIGNILYKIAGLLLPIIFVIMTANSLIASQVDSGSMAYILSTPTPRKKVAITQMLYLIVSILLMYVLIFLTSIICLNFVDSKDFTITNVELLKFNICAFFVMFAISGICYLSSAWFDREKNALSVGGGISIFFLVCSILGLFGDKIMPSAIRIKAMNYFNYLTIISLFNVNSVLAETNTYLIGIIILFVIGMVTYVIGIEKFIHKDLPL